MAQRTASPPGTSGLSTPCSRLGIVLMPGPERHLTSPSMSSPSMSSPIWTDHVAGPHEAGVVPNSWIYSVARGGVLPHVVPPDE
jgi:hypothetical protein